MIEQDQSNSVIIAATNHPSILDYALFRRFDDVIQYGLPNQEQIISMLKTRLAGFQPKCFSWAKVAGHASGLSYAEISRAADETLKDCIIHDRKVVSEVNLEHMLEERKLISGKLNTNNNGHDEPSAR